jgi:hypothetical protein
VADFLKTVDRLGIRAEQLKALTDALIVCSTHKAEAGTCESLRYLAAELATDVHDLVTTVGTTSAELCGLASASTHLELDSVKWLPGTHELVPASADACDPPSNAGRAEH